jgi:hypothetical protein
MITIDPPKGIGRRISLPTQRTPSSRRSRTFPLGNDTCGFMHIGGWLKSKGKISDEEHATYFWQGIPHTLQLQIKNWLLAQDPTCSLAQAWPVNKVEAVAEAMLQRDHFDRNLIDSDDEEEEETNDEDSQEDEADLSDEDSGAEIKRLKKKKAKKLKELSTACKTKKKLLTKKYIDSDDEDSCPKKVASKNSSTGKSGSGGAYQAPQFHVIE